MINPPDGAWGSPDENGTWSGLIGHALYGMSNWSFSGLAVGPEVQSGFVVPTQFILVIPPKYLKNYAQSKSK